MEIAPVGVLDGQWFGYGRFLRGVPRRKGFLELALFTSQRGRGVKSVGREE
jgi:hypothetical protein